MASSDAMFPNTSDRGGRPPLVPDIGGDITTAAGDITARDDITGMPVISLKYDITGAAVVISPDRDITAQRPSDIADWRYHERGGHDITARRYHG